MGLKPAAELESVKLSLIEEQTQEFFAIHFSRPHGVEGSSKPNAHVLQRGTGVEINRGSRSMCVT
jgi:hypothetical protein